MITVNSGVQLNISNCISLAPGGTYDGIYYGGPYIQHAKNAVGPGITVLDGGTVELFDGDVTQNSDGVVVENGGTLSVRGDISENTGAGVRLEEGGTLSIISGGRILLNNGCGVDVAAGSNFTVSGGAEVRNNTKDGETCNVYLQEGATMKLSELSGAKIGVTVANLPTDGEFVKVTSDGKASRNDQNCITSDNTIYRVFYSTSKSNGNLVLDARPTPLHADHNSETFVNSLSSFDGKLLINGEEAVKYNYNGTTYYDLPDGNYYLEGDLTLSYGLLAYSTNVVLCLNGHNITVTGNRPVVCVGKKTAGSSSSNGEVTLTDCETDGTLTHSDGLGGGVYVRGGTFIMRGGKISGNSYGVDVYQGNEFQIYGGEISGNKSYGVSLTPVSGAYSGNGNIYMTVGGTARITGNWADGQYNAATGLYEQGTTGTAKNVLFTDKPFKYITVDSTLTEGAEIGVTIWRTVTAERDCVAVATCGTALSADASPYVKYFKNDSADYKVWSRDNNVVIGVWNSEDQSHPVCGAVCNHKDASGKPVHNENIVWTPVSSATGLNNGDNIYLTDDITLTRTWQISAGGTVNLCLNGHTITANGDFDAITLTSNTNTLNICDCNDSGVGKGIITHAEGTTGSGVYMTAAGSNKATVNMYGGTITGNTGHTVTVKNVDSTRGGGVYVDSNAQFTMRGGSITKNTADVGGGVYYTASNSLYVSGNVNITDNKDTSGAASNVNVPTSSGTPKTVPFYIGDDGLDSAAKIGVRLASEVIATGEHSPVAQFGTYANAESAYHEGNFLADNEGDYSFKVAEREQDTITSRYVVNLYNGLHEHPICGDANCTDHGNSITDWKGIANLSEITEDGNYYLTKDVEITAAWMCSYNVNLCLNGHSITLKQGATGNVITINNTTGSVSKGATLSICDCDGSKEGNGMITGAANSGVFVQQYNTFHLYSGKITGNSYHGVGVSGNFYMHGGTIQGNTRYGVNIDSSGDLYVSGNVNITDNTQGNVYLEKAKTLHFAGKLNEYARIGITFGGTFPSGTLFTVAEGADGNCTEDNFIADKGAPQTIKIENGHVNLYNGLPHKHAICGKTAEKCTDRHSDEVWTPLTSVNGKPYAGNTALTTGQFNQTQGYVLPAGHYYLSDALNLNLPLLIKNGVYLCLNGQTLTVKSSNSAVIIDTGCDLTLCDCSEEQTGKITHANGATGCGVYMGASQIRADLYTGRFTMYGGSISGNKRESGGAGVYMYYGTFNMYGGSITNNSVTGQYDAGGGVYVQGGMFNMSGNAVISNNNAYGGGGVYVGSSGTFNMSGNAAIAGNTASLNGGGVYVYSAYDPATFTMSDNASVSGNNANGNGGGVYVAKGTATTTVSGSVQITDNWKNGTLNTGTGVYENGSANNLYLFAYETDKVLKTVTIGGDLTGAKIGVTTSRTPTASSPVQIATGAQDGVDYTKIFTPDMTDYTVTKTDTTLYLSAHTHDWEYSVSADNQTIIAECKDTTCTSSDGGSVTISKPKHEVYRDGKEATAKVTQNSWAADTVSDVTYKNYTGDETPLSPAPTDAGHYIASITVGGKTAWVDYEIGKATPTADDFNFTAPTDPTYNGEVKSADFMWVDGVSGMGKIGIRHYNESGEMVIPKDAGTYTVKITVAEGTNYKAAEAELTKDSWTFTILQADYTGQKSDKTIDIVKGRSTAQSGTLTAADFFPEGTELPAGAKIASVTPASGAMMASVTVNDGTLTYTSNTNITATENESYTVTISTTNYNNFTVTLTFRPADKQPQTGFKFENAAVTKTYGNADFTITATGAVTGSSVTYISSNTAVATVDNTGKVTIKGAGTAVIQATASATDDYAQGVATYELTVSPKELKATDLVATGSLTKTYDGTTTATGITVSVKDGVLVNGDQQPTITGSAKYNSKDVATANTITFPPNAITEGKYPLAATETVPITGEKINRRTITIRSVQVQPKQYDGDANGWSCITGVTFDGLVGSETLTKSTDYGITEATFNSANVNEANKITGEVGIINPNLNYIFKNADGTETGNASFEQACTITPRNSWALTPVNNLTIRYNNRAEQTYTPDWPKLLPAGQKWTYNLEDTKVTGSAVLADHSIGADSGVLTYQLSAGAENDTVTWTITASCNNYESFTLTVKLTLIARNEQTGFAFKDVVDGKVTKTYGDADFTVKATGAATNSSVTYESSDETVATVDSTGKVTIKGAGTATIKAKASATPDYEEKEISYALTVNKLRIPVPTKGTNELEYTGQEQTYLPDGLDTAYCEIESNTATDVLAGGSWHNADVSLKDRSNTEWADGADSTAHRPYPFRITPKPVTVTALDKKITAGQPAPELTSADYTVTGLIGNDTLGGISLYYADPSDLSKAVTPDTGKAGTYAIVVTEGGTGSNNYAPTFVNGTLTIASRPSGGVVAVTYPVNVPGETERGSVSSNVKNASKGSTVTITVEPEDGFQLADLTVTDKDGNELPLTDKGDGKYTFTMPAGKVEVNATFAEKIETSPFADVSTDAYYYEAVKWAAEQGITGGVGGGLFAPDQSCTRAQIVTFLWRAAGSPEPKSMRSFSDVPEDSYYAKAVAWAVENGITVGTSATTFSPDATCTRAQGVTFLFRAAKASADGAPAFRDVAADAYYAAAVKWATDNSVTNGIGGGLFGSDNDCTRAQIVTFLWRLYAGK